LEYNLISDYAERALKSPEGLNATELRSIINEFDEFSHNPEVVKVIPMIIGHDRTTKSRIARRDELARHLLPEGSSREFCAYSGSQVKLLKGLGKFQDDVHLSKYGVPPFSE